VNFKRRQPFRESNDSPFTSRASSNPFSDSPRKAQGRHFQQQDKPRFERNDRSEKPPYNEIDEDEFIRTGNFQALPREHQSRFQPRHDRETSFRERKPSFRDNDFQFRDREARFQRHQDANFGRQSREKPLETKEKESKSRAHKVTRGMPERVKENVKVPDTIPYTTPASEFIYGTSAVEAALRCSRRQLYKLYIYQSVEEELSAGKVTIRKLALSKNIGVKMAFAGWDRLMDKMSAGRPHNGCILEASPLPKLPVRAFQSVESISEESFRVELAPQTREEAAVNGTDDRVPIHQPPPPHEGQRYPVALLLDGVVDPGNMGAIIRSSYFLGIDAIVLAGRNSAPLSPVTIKASAGAAENMPILHVRNEVDFIQRSQKNGWRFYAADAPGPGSVYMNTGSGGNLPIMTSPSVLMMGSEGSGLSSHIKSHADATVSIPGARHSPVLGVESDPARIDSLNVSVAAALLMEKFLQTPLAVAEIVKEKKEKDTVKMW
jgi:predicted rRNA methylase